MDGRNALPAAPSPRPARLRDDGVANVTGRPSPQVLRDHRRRPRRTRGAAAAMAGRHPGPERRLAGCDADGPRGGVSMESLEARIAEWRAYVAGAPGVNGQDVEELEDHLRHQIAELNAAGLTAEEGFLIAVKRLGDVDGLSREFAREHSGRLWKQLLLGSEDEPARSASGWVETLVFGVAAAVAVQVARLAADAPDEEPTWLVRNASLFVLPFLAAYFAHRRQLDTRGWALTAAPFAAAP